MSSRFGILTIADLNAQVPVDITAIGKDSDGDVRYSDTFLLRLCSKAEAKVLGYVKQQDIEITDSFETDEPDIYSAIEDLAEIYIKNTLIEDGFLKNGTLIDVNAYFDEFIKDNLEAERGKGVIVSGRPLSHSNYDW